jgi:hypothetical protein
VIWFLDVVLDKLFLPSVEKENLPEILDTKHHIRPVQDVLAGVKGVVGASSVPFSCTETSHVSKIQMSAHLNIATVAMLSPAELDPLTPANLGTDATLYG